MDDAFLRDFFKLPPKSAPGLPLRDYFAANAMNAIIGTLNGPIVVEETSGDFKRYSTAAYQMADAMLAARKL